MNLDDVKRDMDEIYQDVLVSCTTLLQANLQADYLLDRMGEKQVYTQIEINDFKSIELSSKKIKHIIECTNSKGKRGVEMFIDCLRGSGQKYLAEQLEYELKKKRDEYEKKQKEKEKELEGQKKQEELRESFEDIRAKSQFDGRIIEIKADWFEKTLKKLEKIPEDKEFGGVYTSGKFGEVFKYTDTENGRHLIIKKMSCKDRDELSRHAHYEISWGRVMHYAINPLLAVGEDKDTQTHYLMFPFPEKGTLNKVIHEAPKALKHSVRLGMMCQIIDALTYLHTDVSNFRGMVSHGWVCSENVVVDERFNVRLTNFGKAKEETAETEDLPDAVKQDYKGFGNIILELFTSQAPAAEDGTQLVDQDLEDLWGDYDTEIMDVWGNRTVRESIKKEAEKYKNGQITKEDIMNKSKSKRIQEIHRCELDEGEIWNGDENSKYCDICVINPAIKNEAVLNHSKPSCIAVRVCVGCLRNSYVNPIQCPECHEDIVSPIGQEWAAILISGWEEDKDVEKTFLKDMTRVYEKITSKYPLIMGISEDSVHQIHPGKPKTPTEQLEEAFKDFENKLKKKNVKQKFSLLLYYTGHYRGEEGGFLLDDNEEEEFLDPGELQSKIQGLQELGCDRVVIFLDCCKAPKLKGLKSEKKLPFIQVNACRSEEIAQAIEGKCSLFTSYLLKGLSGKAHESKCLNEEKLKLTEVCEVCRDFKSPNGFISVDALTAYIDNHIDAYNKKTGHDMTETVLYHEGVNWKDATIAYFIDKRLDFEFHLQHGDKRDTWSPHELPEKMIALKQKLLEAFKASEPIELPEFSEEDADILVIFTTTGPGVTDRRDLESMEQVLAAWNLKRKLTVELRQLENLKQGKVCVILQTEGVTVQSLLDILKPECMKEPRKVEQTESSELLRVPLADKGLQNLYADLQKNSEKSKALTFFSKKLSLIKNKAEIKKKQDGEMVITFPKAAGHAKKNFMTFQLKEAKVLSPRTNTSTGPTAVTAE